MNLDAVHTVHCMGACISQGAGFYQSYKQDGGEVPTVVVTIGARPLSMPVFPPLLTPLCRMPV